MNTNHHAQVQDWEHLAQSNEPNERSGVFDDDFDAQGRKFVADIHAALETELNAIATDAQKTADTFWSLNEEMRAEGGKENQGYFGTRVRVVSNSLEAAWFVNRFASADARLAQGGKKKVFSTYIQKGLGFRYKKNGFKSAKDWELEAIELTEDRYELLRQRSNVLSKLRRALAEYERLLDKSYKGESK
ncbi:conjugative transfer protein MobI(A/C) [Eoetvoesiella caeni]